MYTVHIHPTTVARFSPTDYYYASGDTRVTVRRLGATTSTLDCSASITGTENPRSVRVWDPVGDENILKHETKALRDECTFWSAHTHSCLSVSLLSDSLNALRNDLV